MFKNAKIGDRVWSFVDGWGVLSKINNEDRKVSVYFDDGSRDSFTIDGKRFCSDRYPVLFRDKIKFTIPKKPLHSLKIDTKVMVWNDDTTKFKAHFKEFNNYGKIVCFASGTTSFSSYGEVSTWDNYELVENNTKEN